MPRTVAWLAVVALLVVAGRELRAQQKNDDSGTRAVQGVVTDSAGTPLAKAVVQLKDTKTLQIRSFVTDTEGNYHFAGLSTDVEYQLKADHDGASSGWKTLSIFNSKKVATMNLKLSK
jgi:hypothetical protein